MKNNADYTLATELFFQELLRISTGIVWKDPYTSKKLESPEFIVDVEQYILARQGRLSFPIVEQFADEVLMSLGFDAEATGRMMDDRNEIPEEYREIALKRQIEYTISHYDEKNNYYRMLNGLPNKEDKEKDFFYNWDYPDISDSSTPIHLLDISQLYALEAKGYIQKLIDENPTKKYLMYLTDKKIDIYIARESSPYAILWMEESNYTTLVEDFRDTYEECRNMIVSVFYQKIMTSTNTQYVSFLGLLINFQTIIQMHRKFLDTDITRDFYDEDSLRLVYDSYGVPFYSSIPLEYHKRIVKNMNILLSHKGSTRVFYDLFDIFGFDKMAVFEFYLMKVHRFVDGKPVFYKNEDGTINDRAMFDILFGKVKLYNDPTTEMQETRNQERYEDVIRNDPYWINDKDLLDKLYSEEFNYMESKYLGIQTTFNLMKIIYESCYYIKMILDNRELLSATSVYNNATHSYTNLFELVVYLSALIVRKYGYEGNIPTDLHEVGKVMGFNFKENLTILKENITENDYLKNDKTLLQLLDTMTVNSLASVKKVYKNLTALRGYLMSKMAQTDDVETYWAYYQLYQTMMYSEYVQDTFKKTDGTTASSFADMLKDCSPVLYERYSNPKVYNENQEISDALYLLKNSCDELSHIQYADSINIDMIIEFLFKLLKFFKSAKAELTGYEIVYSLISNYENNIKFMNLITRIFDDYTSDPLQSIIDLQDIIAIIRDWIKFIDQHYQLLDEITNISDKTKLEDFIKFNEDMIHKVLDWFYGLTSEEYFIEDIYIREAFLLPGDPITHKDQILPLYEKIMEIIKFMISDEFILKDSIPILLERIPGDLNDKYRMIAKMLIIDFMRFKSEFSSNDSFTDLLSIYQIDDHYYLSNLIVSIFDKHKKIEINYNTQDLINAIHDSLRVGIGKYQFKDKLIERVVYLLYSDIEENFLYYIDQMIPVIFKYFIDENFIITEELVEKEWKDYGSEKMKFFGFVVKEKNKSKIGSCVKFSDSVILRKEEYFED